MSGIAEFTVAPHFIVQQTVGTFGTGALAAGAALGVAVAAYGTYVAVKKLSQDYQQALEVLHQRREADIAAREAVMLEEEAAVIAASTLVAQTQAQAAQQATRTFLRDHLAKLAEQIAELPEPAPELAQQCQALTDALAQAPEQLAGYFEAYRRLADEFSIALAHAATLTPAAVLAAELTELRAEMESPTLQMPEFADIRAQALEQLTALEALPSREEKLIRQGITALRRRVARELKQLAERQHTRLRESEEMRVNVSEMLARLHAVAQQTAHPVMVTHADALLKEISLALTAVNSTPDTLKKLSQQVKRLYDDCEQALSEEAMAGYVGDQVTDVLVSMGYRVTPVESDASSAARTFLAPVDSVHGIQISVAGNGRMGAEMVAFSEEHAQADVDTQQKICSLTTQMMKMLQQRQCTVREKYRAHYLPGEKLKVVKPPTREASQTTTQAETTPRVMTVEDGQ